MISDTKRFSLIQLTPQTPFHIDFNWWMQHDNDWRVHMLSCLCPEHQTAFSTVDTNITIDWIDPVTAEVKLVDGLQHILMTHCAKQPDFLTHQTTLVDAVFRVFLANGNKPLSAEEISTQTGKQAMTIVRTLGGPKVYKGLRPYQP